MLVGYDERVTGAHYYGTVLEKKSNLHEALADAGMLNWDVRKEPIFTADGHEITSHKCVRGDIDGRPTDFSIMKNSYAVVEFPDAFAFAHQITDSSDLAVDSIGYYRGGRRGFCSLRIPQGITVGGVDKVEAYLRIISSHDGSTPVVSQVDFVRTACTNQLAGALRDKNLARYTIRHSGEDPLSRGRLEDARESLGLAFAEIDEFSRIADRWAQEELTRDQVYAITDSLFPYDEKDDSKQAVTRAQNSRDAVLETFDTSPAQQGLGSTAWAYLQAATEWRQWDERKDSDKRATAFLDGSFFRWENQVRQTITTALPQLAVV